MNRTIQRSFPWTRIVLFAEQINVPCTVFLSEKDALVPSERVEAYFRSKNVPVQDFETVRQQLGQESSLESESSDSIDTSTATSSSHPVDKDGDMKCTVFRGMGHGDWTENPSLSLPVIAYSIEHLCQRAERNQQQLPQQQD